jgi:hypothetical protein
VSARDLRQACEAKLHGLRLPEPFTIEAFCDSIAHQRGRRIRLVPMPDGPASPCGIWISTDDADWIFHQAATSRMHQDHIVLHELAHMIFDHRTKREQAEALRARLLPDLAPDVVAEVLGRTSYTSEEERQAEMLAGLIGARAKRRTPLSEDADFVRASDVFGPDS